MSTAIGLMHRQRVGLSMPGLALRSSEAQTDEAAIKFESGTGVPTHVAVQNSVYVREDASDAGAWLYRNTDGGTTWETSSDAEFTEFLAGTNAWTGQQTFSHVGGIKTDAIAERSAGAGVTIDGAKILDGHLVDSVGFYDAAAPTKIARIDVGSVTAGQTRVITMPDANVDLGQLQPLDATLTSLAALGTAADKLAYTTALDTWAEAAITAAGRAILDDATASDQRTTLGVGTGDTPTLTDVRLTASAGAPAGTGVVGSETPGMRKLTLTLTDTPVVLADNAGVTAYGSLKVADLPEGAILFMGAVINLAVTKSSGGVNADWDGDVGLGTVAANNGATPLAGTEQDLVPNTATPQAVAGATTARAQSTGTESGVIFDGTGGALDVYLNFLVDDADHDVTGTPCDLLCNGTITIVYALLGDY